MKVDDEAARGAAHKAPVAPKKPTDEVVVVPKTITPQTRMRAHIGVLLGDAYSVLTAELRVLRCKVDEGEPLSEGEARKFKIYTESLARLAREEREQEKSMDPEILDNEALLDKVKEAKKILEKGK